MFRKGLRCLKKVKNHERKVKSPFMIYAGFESILVTEDMFL